MNDDYYTDASGNFKEKKGGGRNYAIVDYLLLLLAIVGKGYKERERRESKMLNRKMHGWNKR